MTRYFAQLDDNSVVLQVVRATEQEWCEQTYGGTWLETWKDGSQRAHFASVGAQYRADLDAFVPLTEYVGWVLNEETIEWEPPTPMPEAPEGDLYFWCNECEDWKLESEIPESELT